MKTSNPIRFASAWAAAFQPPGIPITRRQSAVRRACDGYTLVETLVAVMLLALTLTVVLQQFSGALNTGRTSKEFSRAVWYAREKMEEIQLRPALAPGVQRGSFNDGYQWETVVEYFEPGRELEPREPIPLLITVRVFWPHGGRSKDIALQTVALTQTKG